MSDTLIDRVTGIIAHQQKVAPETVTIDKTFEELQIDSFDSINIVFALETEFEIVIPDDSVRDIRTVREVVEGVRKLVAEKAAGASGN
jgi:acyl carrier protein